MSRDGFASSHARRETIADLWLRCDHWCHWCHRPIHRAVVPWRWDKATIDHVCPREYGGHSEPWNLVLSCRRCNEARAAAGHCIAALCCAVSVLGSQIDAAAVQRWYLLIRGPVGRDALNRAQFPKRRALARRLAYDGPDSGRRYERVEG